MYFANYIAWGYDNPQGSIARLSRADFYAGAWGSNVEHIATPNAKAFYHSFPIADDVVKGFRPARLSAGSAPTGRARSRRKSTSSLRTKLVTGGLEHRPRP